MTDGDEHSPVDGRRTTRDLRSFGRRHGRPLSARQNALLADVLPRLAIDLASRAPEPLTKLFPVPTDEVWLEIGFGGAEHFLWQAAHYPRVGLIGCEPFQEGVVKALAGAEEKSLVNIRLWPDDARPLLDWLPDASISRAFILFPDPWPKKRQQKRRLINPALLAALGRSLQPGGSLRIATDIDDYARAILLSMRATSGFFWKARQASDWRIRPPDWPMTRYEAKALAAGRRCTYLTFQRDQ